MSDFNLEELSGKKLIDGKYRLISLLGQGGFGKVYKAEQPDLNRTVAIKFLFGTDFSTTEGLRRFQREARVLAKLQQENTVKLYSFGVLENGSPYMAMEFLEGITLESLLKTEGKLTSEKTVLIAIGICRAMVAAHKIDIVHRDLKPANIMLKTESHFVKVLDYGLAKLHSGAESGKLTKSRTLVGTPNYMSPEACCAQPVDERSDIYSLGCILYECLTGGTLFPESTSLELITKQCKEMPKNFESDPSRPRQLEQLVFKCLQKNPANRFQNSTELLDTLELIECGKASELLFAETSTEKNVSSNSLQWIGVSLFVLSSIVAAVFLIQANHNKTSVSFPAKNSDKSLRSPKSISTAGKLMSIGKFISPGLELSDSAKNTELTKQLDQIILSLPKDSKFLAVAHFQKATLLQPISLEDAASEYTRALSHSKTDSGKYTIESQKIITALIEVLLIIQDFDTAEKLAKLSIELHQAAGKGELPGLNLSGGFGNISMDSGFHQLRVASEALARSCFHKQKWELAAKYGEESLHWYRFYDQSSFERNLDIEGIAPSRVLGSKLEKIDYTKAVVKKSISVLQFKRRSSKLQGGADSLLKEIQAERIYPILHLLVASAYEKCKKKESADLVIEKLKSTALSWKIDNYKIYAYFDLGQWFLEHKMKTEAIKYFQNCISIDQEINASTPDAELARILIKKLH